MQRHDSQLVLHGHMARPNFLGGICAAVTVKEGERRKKLWQRIAAYQGRTVEAFAESVANHLEFEQFTTKSTCGDLEVYLSVAGAVRDRLVELANDTKEAYRQTRPKLACYLSLEFLMGRSLRNNLHALDLYGVAEEALESLGYNLKDLEQMEADAGLGNGGLGRLAACYLDSVATHNLPCMGYGIFYQYGMFAQRIEDGQQREYPDDWLVRGAPWVIRRQSLSQTVGLYGHVETTVDQVTGLPRYRWAYQEAVLAVPFDMLVAGYGTRTVSTLRLWSARASQDFDFVKFNDGQYMKAVEEKSWVETISKVLYPNDSSPEGKQLRLLQQFFFSSASLQDILQNFREGNGTARENDWARLPDKVAIQLNDTHPAVSIAEMMRLLVDVYNVPWEEAWSYTTQLFSYTNHTVLPEALEVWPVDMFAEVLPRHLQIVYEINFRFLEQVHKQFPGENDLVRRVSIIEEQPIKSLRMAHLAIIGSHAVNGVAELHTNILKSIVFADFVRIFPDKFLNITNGVTPRRWLSHANPHLSDLICQKLGSDAWVTDLRQLKALETYADDEKFCAEWFRAKQQSKDDLTSFLKGFCDVEIVKDSIFDMLVKRIHEYKRQLLAVLYVVWQYFRLQRVNAEERAAIPDRTVFFGGKTAPGYHMAKLIINLINDVARVINADTTIDNKLKVVFVENFTVSLGERMYPAADVSEQISTAGLEASGTGNMKFCLNGALIVGTLDGANIEIKEEIGENNIFTFGLSAEEVRALRPRYDPLQLYHENPELRQVVDAISTSFFCPERAGHPYEELVANLLSPSDPYVVLADFDAYCKCQQSVEAAYLDRAGWVKRSITTVANMGKFSSDRAIKQYATKVWGIKPVEVFPKEPCTLTSIASRAVTATTPPTKGLYAEV